MKENKKIVIGKKTYEISFPNVAQTLEIESLKQILSNGQYSSMVRSNIVSAKRSLDLIDAIATFRVIIPEIKTSLDFENLSLVEGNKLVKVYEKQFLPWYEEMMKEIYQDAIEGTDPAGE